MRYYHYAEDFSVAGLGTGALTGTNWGKSTTAMSRWHRTGGPSRCLCSTTSRG